MQAFEYANPTSLKEAISLLGNSWEDANVMAGGTDQISLMKEYLHTPKRVVSIRGIKELGGISRVSGGVRIGAAATVDDLVNNQFVRSDYPALVQAGNGIASPQMRNMGTVGGDLCQRPRCWYFRNGFGLLATKDGRSLVENGQNEYHAIFHNGAAKFVSASSFGPALIAYGAKLKIASASGNRDVDAAAFFVTPTSDTMRETDLKPNEILTEITLPASKGTRSATYEVRQKDALDWPLAAASVVLQMKGNTVESASIVLGHVAPTPHVAAQAAQMLAGKAITEDVAEQAGKAAVQGAKPMSGNEYKVQLASVAVKRALLRAIGKEV
jgi:xanthine dehydrogenase YagS FAD-binding subunit